MKCLILSDIGVVNMNFVRGFFMAFCLLHDLLMVIAKLFYFLNTMIP